MPSNPSIVALNDAVLLDKAFSLLQWHLENQLAWLTTAYGKAERRIRMKDRRAIIYPAVYANEREYLSMLPDAHLGNYCFFDVQDGYQVDISKRHHYKVNAEFGIVFWFDFRTVYPADWEQKTTQNVIEQVLNSFYLFSNYQVKKIEIGQIWEQAGNIYSKYTHQEIENQFLMRPYGGFRIDLQMSYLEPCDPGMPKLEGVNYWIVEDDNIVQP